MLRVPIAEGPLDILEATATESRKPVETFAADVLTRFGHIAPTEHVVILTQPICERLTTLLGGGSIRHGADLVQRVERLASLRIGRVQLDFTTSEWDELRQRADRNQITVARLCADILEQMKAQFFTTYVPPP